MKPPKMPIKSPQPVSMDLAASLFHSFGLYYENPYSDMLTAVPPPTYLLGTIPGILVLGRVQALHARLDNVQRRVAEDAGGARDAAEHADHQLGHGFAGVALTVPVLQRFHHVKSAQKNP